VHLSSQAQLFAAGKWRIMFGHNRGALTWQDVHVIYPASCHLILMSSYYVFCAKQYKVLQAFKGKFLTTFKLHQAAMHLPDQVRACGAGYLFVEYWVERLVQLVKRMVKYRSTAYPELLFVHDWILALAYRRVRLTEDGASCCSLEEALEAVREAKRRIHDTLASDDDALLLGAAKPLTEHEVNQVLPQAPAQFIVGDQQHVQGLVYLLLNDPDLSKDGWPSHPSAVRITRHASILQALGQDGPLGEGTEGVSVSLQKFFRAHLPIGETVSCVQCTTQRKKNNQWAMVEYVIEDGAGNEQLVPHVVHFQYFVRAVYTTADGTNTVTRPAAIGLPFGTLPKPAVPLRIGMARVYRCEVVSGPGVRPADAEVCRLPELVKVVNVAPVSTNIAYTGDYPLDLRTINCQLVPTKEAGGARYFMVANRLSGRSKAIRR